MEPKTPKDGLPAIFAGRMPSNISHAARRAAARKQLEIRGVAPAGWTRTVDRAGSWFPCLSRLRVSASPCWKEEGVMRSEGGRSRLPCDGTLQLFGLFVEK